MARAEPQPRPLLRRQRLNPTHSCTDCRSFADCHGDTVKARVEVVHGADFERSGYPRSL